MLGEPIAKSTANRRGVFSNSTLPTAFWNGFSDVDRLFKFFPSVGFRKWSVWTKRPRVIYRVHTSADDLRAIGKGKNMLFKKRIGDAFPEVEFIQRVVRRLAHALNPRVDKGVMFDLYKITPRVAF